jgi:hypothetical protein
MSNTPNPVIRIIGDSFFTKEDRNWLHRAIDPTQFTIHNSAKGGTGFWRQLDQVKDLKNQDYYNNIEYCIVGWSHPFRMYAPEYARDWRMNDPALCNEEFFGLKQHDPGLEAKQGTVSNMIKYDLINEGRECTKAYDLLQYVDAVLYPSMPHIKFINFFCFDFDYIDETLNDFNFKNAVTVHPTLFDICTADEKDPDKKVTPMDVDNHLNHVQHKGMALMLANIIRDTEQFKRVDINKWL